MGKTTKTRTKTRAGTRAKVAKTRRGGRKSDKTRGGKVKVVATKAVPPAPTRLPKGAPRPVRGKVDTDKYAKWLFKGSPHVQELVVSRKSRSVLAGRRGRPDAEARMFLVTLTPEVQERMLSTNVGNRGCRSGKVRDIEADIDSGRFFMNIAEPILFSWDGHGVSLQHRLKALVGKDETDPAHVILGLDPKIKLSIDQGATRSVADTLHYMGVHFSFGNAKAVARSVAYDYATTGRRPCGGNLSKAERVAGRMAMLEEVHALLLQKGPGGKLLHHQDAADSGSQAAFMLGIEHYGAAVRKVARAIGGAKFRVDSPYEVYRQWSKSPDKKDNSGNNAIMDAFKITIGLILAVCEGRSVSGLRDLVATDAEVKVFKSGKPLPRKKRAAKRPKRR